MTTGPELTTAINALYVDIDALDGLGVSYVDPASWSAPTGIEIARSLDATNTGAVLGGSFPEYTGPWPLSGTITNKTFTGTLTSYTPAANESWLISNCIIKPDGNPYNAMLIHDDNAATIDCRIEYSEIIGGSGVGDGPVNGIAGALKSIHRCNIHNVQNGINTWIDGQEITENFIHTFTSSDTHAHWDGIENNGCDGLLIRRNKILLDQGDTGCTQNNNYYGSITNIYIEDNVMAGGGYPVYCDGRFVSTTTNPVGPIYLNRNDIYAGYWEIHGSNGWVFDEPAASAPHVILGTGADANNFYSTTYPGL